MMNRRKFLGAMSAATVMARHLAWAANEHKIEKIGIQLFTVQDALERNFDGTLSKIAAMGYREVELGPYVKRPPKEVRAALDRVGLTSPSTVYWYKDIVGKWEEVLEACQVIGHRYLVIPTVDGNEMGGWAKAAESFNRTGAIAKKAGIQLAYHNHAGEFVPDPQGKLPYDILLKECDPALVAMEMDLCWINVGRADPLKYFAQYPGHFPLVHVKDVKRVPVTPDGADFKASDITEVGNGVIDFKRMFSHSRSAGIKHYFVEQDNPSISMKSAESSYGYLSKLRF